VVNTFGFTRAQTAIAAGIELTPPAIIKLIAAPALIPWDNNASTNGTAAYPFK
jgi:hypothetical protein